MLLLEVSKPYKILVLLQLPALVQSVSSQITTLKFQLLLPFLQADPAVPVITVSNALDSKLK